MIKKQFILIYSSIVAFLILSYTLFLDKLFIFALIVARTISDLVTVYILILESVTQIIAYTIKPNL